MPRRLRRLTLALFTAVLCAASVASARQIRVDLSGFSFTPSNVTLNQGDHAVWVWVGGTHSVLSGANAVADGIFSSGSFGSAQTFTWKSDRTGALEYYCGFHGLSMVATLNLVASGASASLADFRITEVQYNAAGNADLVEITNLGSTSDLGKYRLKISGATVQTLAIGASTNIAVPAGGRVVLHIGQSGTNTTTDLFFNLPAGLPDAAGSVALYVPNTQTPALTLASQMVDYVAWGAAGQENEATAASALVWTAGTSVGAVAAGHSIEFCGQGGQYGASRWYENPTPNFGGSDNCLTPVTPTTWGRIKTLYR